MSGPLASKEQALGNYLLLAMDFPTRGRWSDRKYTLMYLLQQYGVECIIIDDAHDLSMPHLILLKEITDQLRLPPMITRWGCVWSPPGVVWQKFLSSSKLTV